MYKIVLRFAANYTPVLAGLGIRAVLLREYDVLHLQSFESPTRAVHHPRERFVERLPNVNCRLDCFSDSRQCDQLAEDCGGFGGMLRLQAGVRSAELRAQEQREGSRLYGCVALVDATSRYVCDAASFFVGYLTNLHARFRGCLQNIALRFLESQAKVLPFRSPVSGL